MKIKKIYDFLDFIAPFKTAEEWDNCGLSVGSLNDDFTKILVALDVTEEVIDEALELGAEVVVTHHPLIFTPLTKIESDSLVYKAVKSGITFISSHTCLDKTVGGVNDCLAVRIGLNNIRHSGLDDFLKLGDVDPISAEDFALQIKENLNTSVNFAGCNKSIKTVAVCSGGGGDLINAAAEAGADAFVTGEAKHHEFLEAKRLGVSLFTARHFETEVVVLEFLRKSLALQFEGVEVIVSKSVPPTKCV